MPHNRTLSAHHLASCRFAWLRAFVLSLLIVTLTIAAGAPDAAAKAPPLATTLVQVAVYAGPDVTGPSLGALPPGTEVELTGSAAPGFIAISFNGQEGWVPAQFLSVSDRPGIDTAVALVDTPLLEAPMPDAGVVIIVPEGGAVILTGASVDGYDAASHEGSGGWINRMDIAE